MTEWKSGMWGMVKIISVDISGFAAVGKDQHGYVNDRVLVKNLRPLPEPEPDKITALERAVVDAAEDLADALMGLNVLSMRERNLVTSVNALRAARTSPDPVKELQEAWAALQDHMSGTSTVYERIERVSHAIAAIETAKGAKP